MGFKSMLPDCVPLWGLVRRSLNRQSKAWLDPQTSRASRWISKGVDQYCIVVVNTTVDRSKRLASRLSTRSLWSYLIYCHDIQMSRRPLATSSDKT